MVKLESLTVWATYTSQCEDVAKSFLKILNQIESQEPPSPSFTSNSDVYQFILSRIRGFYESTCECICIPELIKETDHEVAKLCILLLYWAVQCEMNNFFVDKIKELDCSVQQDIKYFIELATQKIDHENALDDPSFLGNVESTHTLEAAIGTPPPSKPIAAETPKSSISGLRGMATPMRKMKRFYNGLCSPAAIGWLCSPAMLAAESGTSHPPANTETTKTRQLERHIKTLEEAVKRQAALLESADIEIDLKDKQVEMQQQENKVIQNQLLQLQHYKDEADEAECLRDQVARLERDKLRLERNLQKSTTLSDELEASQLKLRGYNQLEGEFEDLKKDNAKKSDQLTGLTNDIVKNEREKRLLTFAAKNAKAELERQLNENQKLKENLKLKEEMISLMKQTAEEEICELKRKIDSLVSERQTSESTIGGLLAKVKLLHEELEKQEAIHANQLAETLRVQELNNHLSLLLKQSEEENEEQRKERSILEKQVEIIMADKAEIEIAKETLEDKTAELNSQLVTIEATLKEMVNERDSLRNQIKSLSKESQATEGARQNEKIISLIAKMRQLEVDNSHLKARLAEKAEIGRNQTNIIAEMKLESLQKDARLKQLKKELDLKSANPEVPLPSKRNTDLDNILDELNADDHNDSTCTYVVSTPKIATESFKSTDKIATESFKSTDKIATESFKSTESEVIQANQMYEELEREWQEGKNSRVLHVGTSRPTSVISRGRSLHHTSNDIFGTQIVTCDLKDPRRISELQKRNSTVLPHLRSSYPVETQVQPDSPSVSDQAIRTGMSTKDENSHTITQLRPYILPNTENTDKCFSLAFNINSSSSTLTNDKQIPERLRKRMELAQEQKEARKKAARELSQKCSQVGKTTKTKKKPLSAATNKKTTL